MKQILTALLLINVLSGHTAQFLQTGADPDVYFDGTTYYLSYTHQTTRIVPFLTSTNGTDFTPHTDYNPSEADPEYDYYCIWAPDLNQWDETYILFFSAIRIPKGEKEKSYQEFVKDGKQVSTFFATAKNNQLKFSKPSPATKSNRRNFLDTLLKSTPEQIRIDADLFIDEGSARLFYVWFQHGNNIASVNWPEYSHLLKHVRPEEKEEEYVTEAPCVFKRNGLYYLIYSHGHFTGRYGMSYLMADSPEKLTRGDAEPYLLASAKMNPDGSLIENIGHCSVAPHKNGFLIFYHRGKWRSGPGSAFDRKIYCEPLTFRPDGTIDPLQW